MGTEKEQQMIAAAIARFPAQFGLRNFQGTFRISERNSYFTGPGECGGFLMLYTQILKNGEWLDFAKGTEAELRANIIERVKVSDCCKRGFTAPLGMRPICSNCGRYCVAEDT